MDVDREFIIEAVKDGLPGFYRMGIPRPYEVEEFILKMKNNWLLNIQYNGEKNNYRICKLENPC